MPATCRQPQKFSIEQLQSLHRLVSELEEDTSRPGTEQEHPVRSEGTGLKGFLSY